VTAPTPIAPAPASIAHQESPRLHAPAHLAHAPSTGSRVPARSSAATETAIAPVVIVGSDAAAPTSAANLGDELALLREARSAIRAHDGALALRLLEQHASRFPSGMLREEREATRVIALCELDRVADARGAAQHFFAMYPHSPHATRVRASCAGETP
jgi:hypothetical protein